MFYFLRSTLQLILSPIKGWEDIEIDGELPRKLFVGGVIPVSALASLTLLLPSATDYSTTTFLIALARAFVCFLSFFATYYVALFAFTLYMPQAASGTYNPVRCPTFIAYALGIPALLLAVIHCIPVDLAISFLIPLYTFYILWRGLRYMDVSFTGVPTFIFLILFSLILPPYIFRWVFSIILP